MGNIEQSIRDFLRENFLFDDEATRGFAVTDSFLDLAILDSQGMMELVNHVEQHWQIEIADDELIPDNFDSIAAIERFVARKLG